MRTLSLCTAAALVAATLLAPAIALAGEARASGNATVRECPRSYCDIIGNLEDDEYYEVIECTRHTVWCLVAEADDEDDVLGWARGSSLVGSAAKVQVTPFTFLVTPDFMKKKP